MEGRSEISCILVLHVVAAINCKLLIQSTLIYKDVFIEALL
jgi:hypothetical protein